ncbi:MAG: DUF4249 family protein [Bacteroidetes bacterium]|nr:MAG: DUF4249 family protein [Bacteroidota bacterium]
MIKQEAHPKSFPKGRTFACNSLPLGKGWGWAFILLFISCQKDIEVKLPDAKPKICVDGKIEPGLPPFVILTHNMPYFGTTNLNALQNMFVHNAVVKISNGTTAETLSEYCSASLPDSLLPIVAAFTGVDTVALKSFNYCLYTTFNTAVWGAVGATYNLTIDVDGKSLTSSTRILNPVPLDSTWFRYIKVNNAGDSLGFVFAHINEPEPEGDCYRWLAMRKGKDQSFIAPIGSVFDDKFVNGQSFDFAYNRGSIPNSPAPDDNNEEEGYFKIGDTVIVKYCTIERATFDFFRQVDVAVYSQGNPFAAPTSVPSNVYPKENALGVWCGYGTFMDTVVFK